jgi:ribosomal protein S18 acetylase RimI-like enzyme
MPPVLLATHAPQILACWPALHLLHPKLQQATFLPQIQRMQQQGYQLAYIESDDIVVAVMGFRYLDQLHASALHIDDLATLPAAQGHGYASHLLDYAVELAQELRLDGVALDSSFSNNEAQRLYLRNGFRPLAFHYYQQLSHL